MRRLGFALAVAGVFWFAVAGGCVDVGWEAGVRCDGESCPAGLMCCSGRCYASCGSTAPQPDAGGTAGAASTGDAGTMSVDATGGTGGMGGFRLTRPGFGGSGTGSFFGPGPRGF
ncbi:MAG: hypothetical protein ACJ8F1_11620 [Polyangia bacterium]